MRFLRVDKQHILKTSERVGDLFCYTLGTPVEIMSTKKNHKNDVIATNLSSDVTEDRLMIKYSPTNKIYFTERFLYDESEENSASISIDTESNRVCVGCADEFNSESGTLIFSGALSFNNLVEHDYKIMGSPQVCKDLQKSVHVLAIGVRGNKLLALMYIPCKRGVAIDINNDVKNCYSSNSGRLRDCTGWQEMNIKSWFDGTKVKEV